MQDSWFRHKSPMMEAASEKATQMIEHPATLAELVEGLHIRIDLALMIKHMGSAETTKRVRRFAGVKDENG